jgi:hypothetical protein
VWWLLFIATTKIVLNEVQMTSKSFVELKQHHRIQKFQKEEGNCENHYLFQPTQGNPTLPKTKTRPLEILFQLKSLPTFSLCHLPRKTLTRSLLAISQLDPPEAGPCPLLAVLFQAPTKYPLPSWP